MSCADSWIQRGTGTRVPEAPHQRCAFASHAKQGFLAPARNRSGVPGVEGIVPGEHACLMYISIKSHAVVRGDEFLRRSWPCMQAGHAGAGSAWAGKMPHDFIPHMTQQQAGAAEDMADMAAEHH
jgi:hypothetical protein